MDEPWIELLNSDWHDYMGKSPPQDRLEDPQWLQKFLAQWQLSRSVIAAKTTLNSLSQLRSLLKQLVLRIIKGHCLRSDDIKKLNAYLADGPFHCQIQQAPEADHEYRLWFDSVENNLKTTLAHIAKSFADILVEGDPARIKLCENPDCRWVFYDSSRSRTRRWCEGASGCGNLLKVRRFRERKKKKSRSN
ncbi:MAG: CGNR zinc finger domain-containing protein [Planctomycetes bacterium]|nr:CGNR zinc finger domain-containing protein [Planctomycetota bacterium]